MSIEIIAEIGSSHAGSFNRAIHLIDAAADAGADVIKFQLFSADTLWHRDSPHYADTQKVALPPGWLPELVYACEELGKEFMCTPFSPVAVEQLEIAGVKRYKIASSDITYTPLLQAIGETRKPVLLSTGFSYLSEITTAINTLHRNEAGTITLLHCVGKYPTLPEDMALKRISRLQAIYPDHNVGLSSHCLSKHIDIAAVPLGITVLEKHIDLGDLAGPEAGHSLTPDEFAELITSIREVEMALQYDIMEVDRHARDNYRRSPIDWLRPAVRDEDGIQEDDVQEDDVQEDNVQEDSIQQ